ncbi:hypothetical protein ACFFV7_06285 [Nonomuraea spiralis]|uniref:Alkaline shock response membrane anchor protein AmaP n=1 Tax=Nonomuraea spiralis TaxID=46182 RepID=A0ABV5IA30_9ACTN|nr:hypothetical protein [Nonomuraea spiralis]GGS74662.1 hypothetical protein GCM10010176_016980 [Nonomuraea spiralis]
MNRKTGRGNRWGLALVGLALAVLGGLTLARGLLGPSTPIVDGDTRAFFAVHSPLVWWAVAALSILVALLALRWLIAQGRRDARTRLRLENGPDGVTEIAAGGMAHAVAADVEASPAVLNADADLVGPRGRPEVRLRVAADEAAPMSELSGHLSRVTLPNLRDALDRDHVPAVARVSLEPSPATQRVVR